MNIVDIIRVHALERPDQAALIDGGTTLSWGALQSRVLAVAAQLRRQGVAPGQLVLLAMRSSIAHTIGALALSHVGAIFCGVDWRQRPAERAALHQALLPDAILADHPGTDSAEIARLVMTPDWYGGGADTGVVAALVTPSSPSALILSSGTTGRPKAVTVHLAAQAWRTLSRARDDGLAPGTRVLQTMPLWTSAGISGLLAQLLGGATTWFLPLLHSPEDLIEALQRHRIAQVTLVPTLMRALLERAGTGAILLPHIEELVCLGSAFHADEKRAALARITPHIFERYGSAGTGVIARATPRDLSEAPDSVGAPANFVRIEIVDPTGAPLPADSVGTVRVASPGNAHGYWRDDGTERRGEIFADGWVYPGDLGRLRNDGRLYLEGRRSTTIIRGGQNLQPEEIEQVLMQHAKVADVAVVALADARLGEVPVALLVMREPASSSEIIGHCRTHLQSYKVPAAIRFVDHLPRNAGGKVDRTALLRLWAEKA